jgi:hypothetical protein
MYLIVGHEKDLCCQLVGSRLRELGKRIFFVTQSIIDAAVLTWSFDSAASSSSLRLNDGVLIDADALDGVLIRHAADLIAPNVWSEVDLEYIQVEAQAATVAWLASLDCPIVNRLSPDLWFRSQRSLPEWNRVLLQAGLPIFASLITNDLDAGRCFAEQWNGEVIFAPVTTWRRYRIATLQQWNDLAQLIGRFPVTLIQPYYGPSYFVSLIGDQSIWNRKIALQNAVQDEIEEGLRRLSKILGTTFLQIELVGAVEHLGCANVYIHPSIDVYEPIEQKALASGIVEILAGSTRQEKAP